MARWTKYVGQKIVTLSQQDLCEAYVKFKSNSRQKLTYLPG